MVDATQEQVAALENAELAATPDQPVKSDHRIVSLDFIRGIAVLGILFANITAFGQPFMAYFWPQALTGGYTQTDSAVWVFQMIFIDYKFRIMFTLLFGAGIYLFMERAWSRGSSRWLQFRRLVALAVFGLIHYFLIWRGDILTVYALWGIIALSMMKWKAKTQLITGIAVYIIGSLLMLGMMGGNYLAAVNPDVAAQLPPEAREQIAAAPAEILEDSRADTALFTGDSYSAIVADTIENETGQLVQELIFVGLTETLALILMGMALYRYGFFNGTLDPVKMKRWGWTGVIGGMLFTAPIALWTAASGFPFFQVMFAFQGLLGLPAIFMSIGLMALFALWAPTATQTALGQRFVAAGRMAFTNYLGTSIILLPVFHGWGLGLFGELHRLELFGVVLAVWVLMLLWSKWWLDRFRYGPLEWLWRCMTYLKVFPLKR
ncbi:DUF418 domain-containing protein [Altererythrobacter aquiaggeris]|uniref:DUF418 domain-containing protein n=1 Tax=Aestuarierythrobacter aquiaggeris TaxID=1898396 RepID=UPI00301814B9